MDENAVYQLAYRLMGEMRSHPHREQGAPLRHGLRLMRGVLQLRARITCDSSHDEILRWAALFHDMEKGQEPHAERGGARAAELLPGVLPSALAAQVSQLITHHDDRTAPDLWRMIFQDADVLDHIGCYEIWMSFATAFDTGRGMEEASSSWYQAKFEPAMEQLRKTLHFSPSRMIFDEKVAFERQFLNRLQIEAAGDYVKSIQPSR